MCASTAPSRAMSSSAGRVIALQRDKVRRLNVSNFKLRVDLRRQLPRFDRWESSEIRLQVVSEYACTTADFNGAQFTVSDFLINLRAARAAGLDHLVYCQGNLFHSCAFPFSVVRERIPVLVGVPHLFFSGTLGTAIFGGKLIEPPKFFHFLLKAFG
jgi:hypothetical protein